MCDKIQLKKEAYETSLFHHGLVKLLVLDSLHKIGKDWDSFVFMAGFPSKTGLTPLPVREKEDRSEGTTLAELRKEITDHSKSKAKTKKPERSATVKDTPEAKTKKTPKLAVEKTPEASIIKTSKSSKVSEKEASKLSLKETPESSKQKTHKRKDEFESSKVERVSRVRTRGQLNKEKGKLAPVEESPVSRGSLNDLLEAIELEQEHPIQVEPLEIEQDQLVSPMHIDLTLSSPESSKKSKASKKLKFEEPGVEYAFKPRRPMTRRQMKEAEKVQKEKVSSDMPRTEALEIFSEMVQAAKNKSKDKKVVISQSGNVIAIKKQAGVSKEIPQVSNVFKEKAVRYTNYRKAVMKGKARMISQASSVSDAYVWTVPALKQAKTMKQVNVSLKAENKKLKKEVISLREKLDKLAK